jgi:hypothetical protein
MPEKKKRILEAEIARLREMLAKREQKVVDARRKLDAAIDRMNRG